MSFRILNVAPQYLLPDGRVNAGGSLSFYETDLTTPKVTYSDEALTIPNTNPVLLDSSGRTVTDVWGDGEYGMVLKDALGVTIWTRNNVRDVDNPGAVIPALVNGGFLTNDGSVMLWVDIEQVPDPTGHANEQLGTDGALVFWEPKPTLTTSDVTIATNRIVFKSSDGTKAWQVLKGTATIPASGANTASLPITFANAFKSGEVPSVTITPSPGTQPGGPVVPYLSAAPTASGFTAVVDVAEGNSVNQNVTVAVAIQWCAQGEIDP